MDNNNSDFFAGIALFFVAGIAFIVWKFSNTIGVDASTGGMVLFRLAMILVCWVIVWWGIKLFTFNESWPFFLCTMWPVCWPVLDYWSEHSIAGMFGPDEPIWYAAWYTKLLGFVIVAALGIGINKLIQKQSFF